uniref:Uncharacterized protein n=1 Tax=Tanacetum cinerariifolium TaxID=118510 RepID=A0A699GNJ3_TANCI|nr:hypothetical protein [Tanacetum cinerariifolium]
MILNVIQDINHENFFDIEYSEMPNDDERVDPNLNSNNQSKSDSSYSFVSGRDVNIADFPDNLGSDADICEDIFPQRMRRYKGLKAKQKR